MLRGQVFSQGYIQDQVHLLHKRMCEQLCMRLCRSSNASYIEAIYVRPIVRYIFLRLASLGAGRIETLEEVRRKG